MPDLRGAAQNFAAWFALVIGRAGVARPWILVIVGPLGLVALLETARAALGSKGAAGRRTMAALRRSRRPSSSCSAGAPKSSLAGHAIGPGAEPGPGRARTRPGAFPVVPLNRCAIRRQIGSFAPCASASPISRDPCGSGTLLLDRPVTPGSQLDSRAPDAAPAEAVSEALTALEPHAEESPSFAVGGTSGERQAA